MRKNKKRLYILIIIGLVLILLTYLILDTSRARTLVKEMNKIQIGMESEQILLLIGEPDTVFTIESGDSIYSGYLLWYYSIDDYDSAGFRFIIDPKADTVVYRSGR